MIKVKSTFKSINQMVKVISRDFIEINPGEVVEEVVVNERIFWVNFKKVYRRVHGSIFRYKYGRYSQVDPRDWEIRNYFKLPIEGLK